MARPTRKYSAPIVLTVASLIPTGCGGSTGAEPSSDPRWSTNPPIPQTGGAGGTGGADKISECDPNALSASYAATGFPSTLCEKGAVCSHTTECASGTHTFEFECRTYGDAPTGPTLWSLRAQPCERPADHCNAEPLSSSLRGWDLSCYEGIWQAEGAGGNPPAPCPLQKPQENASCRAGVGFGAARQACGYPCDGGGWTVIGCFGDKPDDAPAPGVPGRWISDGACGVAGNTGGVNNWGGAAGTAGGNSP